MNYLHCCDLNDQFDATVPSLPFVRLNVVFDHFSSLVERRLAIAAIITFGLQFNDT